MVKHEILSLAFSTSHMAIYSLKAIWLGEKTMALADEYISRYLSQFGIIVPIATCHDDRRQDAFAGLDIGCTPMLPLLLTLACLSIQPLHRPTPYVSIRPAARFKIARIAYLASSFCCSDLKSSSKKTQ